MTGKRGTGDGDRGPRSGDDRAQLSLTAVEALVGTVLVLAVVSGFALGVDDADRGGLDTHAGDAAVLLRTDPVSNATAPNASAPGTVSRADALVATRDSFERVRESTRRRLRAALPASVLFRVETPHGALGPPRPGRERTASTRIAAADGTLTVWVWYA